MSTPTIPASASRPGMIAQEVDIFNAWWLQHSADYDRVQFNVRVGQGLVPDPSHDPAVQQMAIINAQKRIDAIVWHGAQPTIVEVKYRALIITLGQALGYRVLWIRDNPGLPTPGVLVLCSQIDIDAAYVYGQLSLPYVVVQTPSILAPPATPL